MSALPPHLDRVPPHDEQAELAVIGGLFLTPSMRPDVEKLIAPDDLYNATRRHLFSITLAYLNEHPDLEEVDLLSLRDYAAKHGFTDTVLLAECTDAVPTGANVTYHAGIVREKAKKRRFLAECLNAIQAIHNDKTPFIEAYTAFHEHTNALDYDPVKWVRTKNGQPVGIREAEYIKMLENYGFRIAKYNGKLEFVSEADRIVDKLEWYKNACVTVKHRLRDVYENDYPALWELLLKAHKFDYKTLTTLTAIEQDAFLDDDGAACRLAFTNGVLTITQESIAFTPHKDGEKYLWNTQICPRPYQGRHSAKDCALDLDNEDEQRRKSDIERFLWRVSTQQLDDGHWVDNSEMFEYAIGFAAWHYNDVANPKSVVIIDCDPSHFSDGRRGKGIILQIFRALVGDGTPDGPVVNLDGKSLQGQFRFQRVTPQTRILMIDDVDPSVVTFEQFYSNITEGLISEGKGLQQFAFTPETTPKIVFTSNKPFFGIERSTSDRMLLLPMTDFFAQEGQKPMQYFGHRLFKDWDAAEWARFYDYMARLIQQAMKRDPMKLPEVDLTVFNANRIYLDLNETFVRYLDDLPDEIRKTKEEVIAELEANKVNFKRGQFKRDLETYARLRGRMLYHNTKDHRYKIEGQEYVMFTKTLFDAPPHPVQNYDPEEDWSGLGQ